MLVHNHRKFLLLGVFCLQLLFGQSQQTISPATPGDSSGIEMRMKALTDSLNRASLQRGMENSYQFFQEYQRKQKQKRQRQTIMYFAMGGAMLAVLIYGLRRKQKKGM